MKRTAPEEIERAWADYWRQPASIAHRNRLIEIYYPIVEWIGDIRMNPENGVVSELGEWILPKRLRRGIREALDGGRGRLRMDPQELANLIGQAIDLEIERIERIRMEREQRLRIKEMLRGAENYFVTKGSGGRSTSSTKFQSPIEW